MGNAQIDMWTSFSGASLKEVFAFPIYILIVSALSLAVQFSGPYDLVLVLVLVAASSNHLADHLPLWLPHHTGPENLRQRGIWQISPDRAWEQKRRKRAANCLRKPKENYFASILLSLLFASD